MSVSTASALLEDAFDGFFFTGSDSSFAASGVFSFFATGASLFISIASSEAFGFDFSAAFSLLAGSFLALALFCGDLIVTFDASATPEKTNNAATIIQIFICFTVFFPQFPVGACA